MDAVSGRLERDVLAGVPADALTRAAPQLQRDRPRARRPDAELDRPIAERPRSQRPLPWIYRAHSLSGTSQIAASGGSVTSADIGCSCHGTGSASTPPRLPVSDPP